MADYKTKTFWLINQYASTPETGMGGRHYYLAKELAKQGHKVYLIAAGYTHLLRKSPCLEKGGDVQNIEEGFDFVWIKMPEYGDAHDKKRVFNWFKFGWKLLKLPGVISDKPDAILYSSPSLIPFLGANRLAKRLGAKLVWDIRDIWPLTLTELGGMSKYHPFIILHQIIEDFASKRSDFIISNWPYAIKHLVTRGADESKFMWLPNGFYSDEFINPEPLSEIVRRMIPKNKFVIGYAGTLGKANAIQSILDTAVLMKDMDSIHFVLVGGGKLEGEINQFVDNNQLSNITLIPPIPKLQIPSMLSNFDVCYVGFNNSPLYEFGNSLNKLPEYLMSGRPILYSINSTFKPVDDAKCGFTVPAEDPKAIAEAILLLKNLSLDERQKMGQNGRIYALHNYDYAKLAIKLATVLSK